MIIERNVRLIIIDPIASLVRKDFDKLAISKRQEQLNKIASQLKTIAETFHLPVIVSNQVVSTGSASTVLSFRRPHSHDLSVARHCSVGHTVAARYQHKTCV